ncbi:MAG: ATPase [Nitrospirales bacterium]|nr:MAG: ATPase [Nitrospirales bacterium]
MTTKAKQVIYELVDASPVKSFFVTMLTRDIKLEDAILDLLDNCVDGILRSHKNLKGLKPYDGFYAEIKFNKSSFSISDNCGGIPWSLKDYAFRMGRSEDRPKDVIGSVGVYGIGMKRAIFKIGKDCLISTQNKIDRYEVEITPEWIDNDSWEIPVKAMKKQQYEDGTTIYITNLYPGIKAQFGTDAELFFSELERMVAKHYAFIIDKGFEVRINGYSVKPLPTKLMFTRTSKNSIQPFIFEAKWDNVEVFVTVGFTQPIPTSDEISDEQTEKRYSSIDAGWTVICNDRAVLYCDRTELTGWGEAGVPRYHTQFIAISGMVEFKSPDASKLPTTTTKRGIDASSQLYLQIKNKMREGMLLFTNYTNKWKGQAEETKKHMANGKALSLSEIKNEAKSLTLSQTKRTIPSGRQYKPSLPLPKTIEARQRRITFLKSLDEVRLVSEYLFEDKNIDASRVGEECFNIALKEAK